MNEKEYGEFISSLQLNSISLSELTAKSDDSDVSGKTIAVKSNFNITYLEKSGGNFTAEARLVLTFSSNDTEIASIDCAYHLRYSSKEQLIKEAFLDEFSKINIPVNVWPFLREIVMTTTQRFGWSSFILPTYKVPMFSSPQESDQGPDNNLEPNKILPKSKRRSK